MNIKQLEKNIESKQLELDKINKKIANNNIDLVNKKKKLINYINITKFRLKKQKEKTL